MIAPRQGPIPKAVLKDTALQTLALITFDHWVIALPNI
jgi:hypothetical protein